MNSAEHFTTIEDDGIRKSTFYIALRADDISSGTNNPDAKFIRETQLCSSVEDFKERSMDRSENQDLVRGHDDSARMKRYGVIVPESDSPSTSHIKTSSVKENVISLPTNSKAISVPSKIPIALLPTAGMGADHSNPSTLSSELSSSAATKKSISFIRRTSSIKLNRRNSLLKTITSKCAVSSVYVDQVDVPVKALDTKQLCQFLSDTANENMFRTILSQDENEIEWKSVQNADGSQKAVCQSSALTLPRDKQLECSSTLSNFFLKRSFRSIPLKRTKSVTKVYVSMDRTNDLCVSRSHENLLSTHVPLSPIGYPNGDAISILPVHASLLGHRHGFQIFSDSFGIKHYSCRSRQERDLWLHGLRKMLTPNNINTLRKDNSLKMWIYEAKSLPTKKRYFCEIYLDKALYGRTSSKLNTDLLFWGEYLEFLDVPNPKIIKINVFCEAERKKRRDKPLLIGSVHIHIQDVMPHVFCEEWYPILTEKKDSKRPSKQSQSTLRVKFRFQSLTILPIDVYHEFLTYLKENYIKLCKLIEPVIGVKAKEEIGQALVLVMHSQSMAAPFLADVVALDLSQIDDQRLTFRGNSLATKSMEAFLKLCGEQYLEDTLVAPIVEIIDSERDCEVDPMKTNGALLKQQHELRSAVEMIWKAILNSINFFPFELRVCFSTFRERLKTLGREDVSDNLISASLFLRFLCPAILSPSLFNITNEMPSARSTRNLTLVAKTLQTLANFTRFQGKEYFMEFLNSFVEQEAPKMKQFLNDISNVQLNPKNERTLDWSKHIDQGKHLAILHSLLLETLTKLSKDEREELAPLETILESISSVKRSENMLCHAEGLDKHEYSLIATKKLNTANGFGQQLFEKVQKIPDNTVLHNGMNLTLHSSYDSLHYAHSPREKDRADNYQPKTSDMRTAIQEQERQTDVVVNQERASTLPRKMNDHWNNSLLEQEELKPGNSYYGDTNYIITSDKQHYRIGLSSNDSLNRNITSSPLNSPLNLMQNKTGCSVFVKSQPVDNGSDLSKMPMSLEDLQDLFNYADEQQDLKNNSVTGNGFQRSSNGTTLASSGNIPSNNILSVDQARQRRISNKLEINYQHVESNVNNVCHISTFLTPDCSIQEPQSDVKNYDSSNIYTDCYRRDKTANEPVNTLHSDILHEKRKEWLFYPEKRGDKCININEISKNAIKGGNSYFKNKASHFTESEGINEFRMPVDNRLNCTYDAALAKIGTISVTNIVPKDIIDQLIYSNGNTRCDIATTNPMVQSKPDEYLEVQSNHPNYDKKEYMRHISVGSERAMSECISETEDSYNSSLGVYQYAQCLEQSNNRNSNRKAIEEHTLSNRMRSNNFQSVAQCEREIQRLQAALDAMRQKLESSEFKHELRTDLTNIAHSNNNMVGGIIGRLLIMEEELRREQQTMYLALSQKQRVIEAQGQQIAALDAANNRLLTALSSMQKKYRNDSTHVREDSIS